MNKNTLSDLIACISDSVLHKGSDWLHVYLVNICKIHNAQYSLVDCFNELRVYAAIHRHIVSGLNVVQSQA